MKRDFISNWIDQILLLDYENTFSLKTIMKVSHEFHMYCYKMWFPFINLSFWIHFARKLFYFYTTIKWLFKSIKTGTILHKRPLALKWVSTAKLMNPKAGILPRLSSYWRDLVPFLMSASPLPFTAPSVIFLGAKPTELWKYQAPKEQPEPKVMFPQIMLPADVPESTISSLKALFLITANSWLGVPSSFSHVLICLDWSPPLK